MQATPSNPDDIVCNHDLFTEHLANVVNTVLFDMHRDTSDDITKCLTTIARNQEIIEMCRTFIRDAVDLMDDENREYYCNKIHEKTTMMRKKTMQNEKAEQNLVKMQRMYTLVCRELQHRGMEMPEPGGIV
jgi:hypothetical protein